MSSKLMERRQLLDSRGQFWSGKGMQRGIRREGPMKGMGLDEVTRDEVQRENSRGPRTHP